MFFHLDLGRMPLFNVHAPAVHTVRRLALWRCRNQAATLLSIAAFPQLEELSVGFAYCPNHFDDTTIEPGVAAAFPKLRVARLSSTLTRGSTSTTHFLALAICAPRLQTLELHYFSLHFHDELIAAFRSMTPTLRLKVFSIFMAPWHLPMSPFMDEVVPRLPSLKTLIFSGGIFSGALLRHLPRTLTSLHLDASPRGLPPESGEVILEYITRTMPMRDPLKLVMLTDWQLSWDLRTRILNTCLEGGIKCEVRDSSP